MNTEELRKWIMENNIKKRTIESFWIYLKNYKIEEPEEFDKLFKGYDLNLLDLKLEKIALTINYHFDNIVEYITSYLILNYMEDEIGIYKCMFSFEGQYADDNLKIY